MLSLSTIGIITFAIAPIQTLSISYLLLKNSVLASLNKYKTHKEYKKLRNQNPALLLNK